MKPNLRVNIDAELIDQVRMGEKQAFDVLVKKYEFKIFKLVSRYVKDPSEAKDVTQESFIKAYRGLDRFRGDSAFYTWLYRIAINTAKNYVVLQSRRLLETNIEMMDTEQNMIKINLKDYAAPEVILSNVEVETMINDVINHLPKDLKTVIMLRDVEGMSYDEIASVMACPVGTVRSRIFRAREAIERRVRPLLSR